MRLETVLWAGVTAYFTVIGVIYWLVGGDPAGASLLLMATGLIYALPPAAIYYAFKRYMVGGLTAGAVKS